MSFPLRRTKAKTIKKTIVNKRLPIKFVPEGRAVEGNVTLSGEQIIKVSVEGEFNGQM